MRGWLHTAPYMVDCVAHPGGVLRRRARQEQQRWPPTQQPSGQTICRNILRIAGPPRSSGFLVTYGALYAPDALVAPSSARVARHKPRSIEH